MNVISPLQENIKDRLELALHITGAEPPSHYPLVKCKMWVKVIVYKTTEELIQMIIVKVNRRYIEGIFFKAEQNLSFLNHASLLCLT